MKRFKEYIEQGRLDTLDDQIIRSIDIHEAFNNNNVYYTFESIGLFQGCKQIIQYLDENYDEIFLSGKDTMDIDSKDIYPNLFFDRLSLAFNDDNKGLRAEYVIGYGKDELNDEYESNRWDIDTQRFRFIEINVYNHTDERQSDILELLTHELTHAYDDYKLHIDNTSLRNRHSPNDFRKELKKIYKKLMHEKYNVFSVVYEMHPLY